MNQEYLYGFKINPWDYPATCVSCGDEIDEGDEYFTEAGPLCWGCYEYDEHHASTVTIYNGDGYYDGYEDGNGEVCTVGSYINETEGEFTEHYVRLGGWRGYAEVRSDDWTAVHEDVALAMSSDEKELKKFHDKFKLILDHYDIPYAIAYCQTSNCCSMNVDFFVKNDDVDKVKKTIKKLEEIYRDPVRFHTTALTGANPEDQTDSDKFFALFASTLLS